LWSRLIFQAFIAKNREVAKTLIKKLGPFFRTIQRKLIKGADGTSMEKKPRSSMEDAAKLIQGCAADLVKIQGKMGQIEKNAGTQPDRFISVMSAKIKEADKK